MSQLEKHGAESDGESNLILLQQSATTLMTAKSVLCFSDMTSGNGTLDIAPSSIHYPYQIHPRTP
jgi:hypothetical protein